MEPEIINKEKMPSNEHVIKWVNEMAAMCKPDKIQYLDASEEEEKELIEKLESLRLRKRFID